MPVWFDASHFDFRGLKAATRTATDLVPYTPPPAVLHAFDPPPAPIPSPALPTPVGNDSTATPPMQIPGMVGDLVSYCWNSAPHQIAEVSIASALSIMSMLCARQYRFGTQGLSLYLLVLAKSSLGKSFCFSANDNLHNALIKEFQKEMKPPHSAEAKARQDAARLMIMGDVGSAQGLAQRMPDSPSVLLHADEFVDTLKEMASPRCSALVAAIKTELLKLVEHSGPGRTYRGKAYSKRSSKVEDKDVISASLTILATGVPSNFYDNLTNQMIASGFIPRFTILEYQGYRLSPKNKNQISEPSPELMAKIFKLFNNGYDRNTLMTGELSDMVNVEYAYNQAQSLHEEWEKFCIAKQDAANARDLDSAPLWSRAKDHVIQIASLIAIGVNPYVPRITSEHINIAIEIVKPALFKLADKVENDQIGSGDARLNSHIMEYMAKLYVGGYAKFGSNITARKDLLDAGIIQVALVKNYCRHLAAFRNHKDGADKAFNYAFENLVRYGYVALVDSGGEIRTKCVKLNLDLFREVLHKISNIV